MSIRRFIILLLAALSVTASAAGEEEARFYFRTLGIQQGLSNQMVNATVKDSCGFVWVGTADGLNRYDGMRFRVFRHEPDNPNSLSTSWVNCLYITRDGRMLVGTERGVNVYDPEKENFTMLSAVNDTRNLLGNLRVRCFCEDSKGMLWIGTLDGLLCFDTANSRIAFYKINFHDHDKMHNEIRSLCEDAEGRMWIGTFDGLYRRNADGAGLFEPVSLNDPHDSGSGDNMLVSGLYIAPQSPNLLCIATSAGFRIRDLSTGRIRVFDTSNSALGGNDVRAVGPYDDTHLLVATGGGLSVFNTRTERLTNYTNSLTDPTSLPTHTVNNLFQDDSGIIWIGTTYGLACCNRYRRPIDLHYINTVDRHGNITRETVTDLAVLPDAGEIWIGTNNGLRRYTSDMRLLRHYTTADSPLPHNNIKRLLIDSRGVMWIGTNNGVVYMDRSRREFRHVVTPKNDFAFKYVYDMKEDTDGDIIVNISSGVCFIRPTRSQSGDVERLDFETLYIDNLLSTYNSDVPYFEPDKCGNIWIGSLSDGIFRYDKHKRTVTQYRNEPSNRTSISSNRIYSIHADALNRVWVGTDLGLCRYDEKADCFERIAACSNLAIRTIVSDRSNRLWIASSNRLVMFDYELDYKIGCDLSQELNMNDIEYNSVCTVGDRIYLGGCGGYLDFDSNDIEVDMRRYPVRLTSFEIHDSVVTPDTRRSGRTVLDRSVTLCDRIRLRHDENFFRIDFAMLNYTFGSGNTYTYMLEGYDKSPQTTDDSHPYALYSHIPPGRYTFRVDAANSDGIHSGNQAAMQIVIRPAWYHSTAARIGCIVLLAGICALAVHLIRMRIRLSRELKQEIMRRERYDEINRTKMAFFTNISHEFKTPLTLILGPIETLLDTADEAQHKMLMVMKHNAERLLRLINQIMDLRKIDNDRMQVNSSMGDIVAFSREIFDLFSDHAARRHIDYTFESHPFCINSLFDCDKVEKIVYNLLSNAFKFTPDGGSIRLRIETDEQDAHDIIRLIVSDTGCGIAAEELPRIFDRFYQTDNRPHEQAEGSGIGLTLTRDYARLHGGDVEVESTPGSGSRFIVTLPYRNASDVCGTVSEADMSEQTPRPDDNRPKIVVVEDNEEMRDFLRTTLDSTYDVTTARDGRLGLETIRRTVPDLIISDLMMPHMDGFELCRCVRDDAQTSHIPFIMLTAKNNEADIQTSYDCGADVFLSKPFSVKTLRTRIEALIESRAKLQKLYRKKILSTPSDIEVESENDKFILRVVRIIEENLENPDFNVSMLCDALDQSYLSVYRKVKALTGDTVNDFVRAVKLKRAAQYLRSGELRISEILYKSGFNSHSYFTKCFKEYFGMTPKEYMERSHSDRDDTPDME